MSVTSSLTLVCPTANSEDRIPQTTAMAIPFNIFPLDSEELPWSLSLSIPAFAVMTTPMIVITNPPITKGN